MTEILKFLRICPLALVLALGVPAFMAQGALAQGQPGDQAAATDEQLLTEVLAALPPGITLETATDEQIAAAVQAVVSTRSAAPAGTPGTPAPDIGSIAGQVLSVVSVTLDSVGRSASSNAVATQVVNALPPQVRSQVQQQVQSSRANPTPSQVAAVGGFLSGAIQSAANQQQQQQQIVSPQQQGQENLEQNGFQENPNQVSGS